MNILKDFYPYYPAEQNEAANTFEAISEGWINQHKAYHADESLLERHTTIDIEQDFTLSDGCHSVFLEGARFEFFFKSCRTKRLYVFLNGARTANGGKSLVPVPRFPSWSWYPKIDANVLSFEDPLYYEYPTLRLGWFYGHKDTDYRQLLARIIGKIAASLEIPVKDIVLYGRSGGGTAALSTAHYLSGCTAVAVNPQLFMEKYFLYEHFLSVTGNDLTQEDPFLRNRIAELIKGDPNSHYLILGNLRSEPDLSVHLLPFCASFDLLPHYGLTHKGNLTVWLYSALGPSSPHNSFENNTVFHVIDQLVRTLSSGQNPAELEALCRYAGEVWTISANKDRVSAKLKKDLDKALQDNQQLKDSYAAQLLDAQKQENPTQREEILRLKEANETLKEANEKLNATNETLNETYEKLKEANAKLKKTNETLKQRNKKQEELIEAADSSLLYRIAKRLRRYRKKIRTFLNQFKEQR